jgi:predicted nucleic acid-binding protein
VVILDTTPFVKLAKIGRLDLIDLFKAPLRIVDQVAYEMRFGKHDQGLALSQWLDRNANRLEVEVTEIGETFRKARVADPSHPTGNLGERAVEEYARRYARLTPKSHIPLVLFEDRDVVEDTELPRQKDVHLINIRSWLSTLKRNGLIPDVDDVLRQMLAHGKLNPEYEKVGRTKAYESVWAAPKPRGIL